MGTPGRATRRHRRLDDLWAEHSLAVVAQQHAAEREGPLRQRRQQVFRRGAVDPVPLLLVDPQDLCGAGDVARLARRRPRGISDHRAGVDATPPHQIQELLPSDTLAHDSQHAGLGTQRHQVGRHIAGASQEMTLRTGLEHQHRRFRRHAAGGAVDVAVEDQIARDQDRQRGQIDEGSGERLHRQAAEIRAASAEGTRFVRVPCAL